jgi:hypothetical protein
MGGAGCPTGGYPRPFPRSDKSHASIPSVLGIGRRGAQARSLACSSPQNSEEIMRTISTSLILILSVGTASAAETNFMSINQMKAEIIGNSMRGKTDAGDEYVEHYAPDGRIIGLSKESGKYEAKWSFRQDGLMCFRYGDGDFDGGCVRLSRNGGRIGIIRVDGSHEPTATLIQGMAPELK